MSNMIVSAVNAVTPVLNLASDICRILYEGYENAPRSTVYPPGAPVPAPNGLDRTVYQAVKTNLAFLDALYVGAKWIATDYWSKFAVGIAVIRFVQIGHGLRKLEKFAPNSPENRTIKADVLFNAVNAVVCLASPFINLPKERWMTVALTVVIVVGMGFDTAFRAYNVFYLDQNDRMEPFDRKFKDYHSQKGMDSLKTVSYVAHFALASVATYVLYQHGQKLLQVALTLAEGRISHIFSFVCGAFGALSYMASQQWGRNERQRIAIGIGSFTALSLTSLFVAKKLLGYGPSLSAVYPQLTIGVTGLMAGFWFYKMASKINDIAMNSDPFRNVLEVTCALVGAAVATALVAVKVKIAQSVQKFWLLALQIGIIVSGTFLLLSATYIGLSRLLLQVPLSDGVEPAYNQLKDKIGQYMP